MYLNADHLPDGMVLQGFDICIVGAGAAGLAMAKRLIGSSKKVLVLSSGADSDKGRPHPQRAVCSLLATGGTALDGCRCRSQRGLVGDRVVTAYDGGVTHHHRRIGRARSVSAAFDLGRIRCRSLSNGRFNVGMV